MFNVPILSDPSVSYQTSAMSQYSYTDLTTTMLGDQQWDQPEWDTSFFWEDNKNTIKSGPPFDELYGQIGDVGLLDKAKTAEKTGDLMPLIKEELKCKIQAKRLASGKEELIVCAGTPKVCEPTAHDMKKREARRAQNRRAAKKYRIKQRVLLSADRQEANRLRAENTGLTAEINRLRQDKQYLLDLLHLHQSECNITEAVVPDCSSDAMFLS